MDAPEPTAPARQVTFVHGVGGSPLTWEEQVSKLPPGLPARAPWLRGLRPGASGADESFQLADAAADILMTLQLDGIDRAAIVGHDLGAMVALQAALQQPDAVSHLVLVAGRPRPPKSAMRLQRLAVRLMPKRRLAERGVSKERVLEALGTTFDADGDPADVRCPTLVVCGAADRVGLPASRVLAQQIPGARLEIVEGAGHDVMHEQTAVFNALLYDFLGHGTPDDLSALETLDGPATDEHGPADR